MLKKLIGLLVGVSLIMGLCSIAYSQKTLRVMFWGGMVKRGWFEEISKFFIAEHPEYKKVELIQAQTGYNQKLLQMVAARDFPDVTNINPTLVGVLAPKYLMNLSEKMKAAGVTEKDYWDMALDVVTLDNHYDKGDPIFAVPLGVGNDLLAYNERIFKENGIAFPTEEWTWKGEFLTVAKKLTRGDQYGFMGYRIDENRPLPILIRAFGGRRYSEDYKRCVVNTPEAIEGIRFLQDLIYKYKVAPTPAEKEAMVVTGLSSGKIGMQIIGSYMTPGLADAMEDPWNMTLLPKGPAGRFTSFYGGNLGIFKKAKHPEAAWEYIKLTVYDFRGWDVQSFHQGFNIPSLKKYANSYAFMNLGKIPGQPSNYKAKIEAMKDAFPVVPVLPNAYEISQVWDRAMDLLFLNKISPEDFAEKVEKEINELLQQ